MLIKMLIECSLVQENTGQGGGGLALGFSVYKIALGKAFLYKPSVVLRSVKARPALQKLLLWLGTPPARRW